MKITLVSFAALAALIIAPIASQASDKEVQKARRPQVQRQKQVALFYSGHGAGEYQSAPRTQSVSPAQTGQGMGVTFFTGNR
jgi:hypothetical protein